MIQPTPLPLSVKQLKPESATSLQPLLGCLSLSATSVEINNVDQLRESIGAVAQLAAFGDASEQLLAHQLAWTIASADNIYPASIDALYRRISSGNTPRFTVPAINVRAIAFESTCGVFQAMQKHHAAAVIFELSRGEIGFTGQRPMEYATVILCAAIAEAYHGPLFLQGDHFQISASLYAKDPAAELATVKALIAEAVSAGFYNIDIDTSTLVNLKANTLVEQQRPNIEFTAELTRFTRELQPPDITISIGGEIGEVGEENSTPQEVQTYLQGVRQLLPDKMIGLSKLSIQSGTRHGGNVLTDGSFGEMNVDFTLIEKLTAECREFALAGCVQHGASMLSLDKIARLPEVDCTEVHLAAAFLNAAYNNLPAEVSREADRWIHRHCTDEWQAGWSEAQFIHHARRLPVGHYKRRWWDATDSHEALRDDVRNKSEGYILALRANNTHELVAQSVTHPATDWTQPLMPKTNNQGSIRDLAS